MDDFIAIILTLFDSINETKKKLMKNVKTQLINNYVIEKQYLAYYIYRFWIKYRKLMEYINGVTEFNKILTYLNIPPKYFKYSVSYPMQDKMITNEKQLDLVILNILTQFNKCDKFFSNKLKKQSTTPPITVNSVNQDKPIDLDTVDNLYKRLTLLLETKTIHIIVSDISMLKILIPNLAKPNGRVSIWEKLTPYIDKIDLNAI